MKKTKIRQAKGKPGKAVPIALSPQESGVQIDSDSEKTRQIQILLRDSYSKAWSNLVDYLQEQSSQNASHIPGTNNHNPKHSDYENKINEFLEHSLFWLACLLTRLCHGKGFSLGRTQIQLNSVYAEGRLRVPFIGSVRESAANEPTLSQVIDGTVELSSWPPFLDWRNEQGWRKYVLNTSNGRDLMFLQADTPTHLLTELMWRIQPESEYGKGFCIGIFPRKTDPLFKTLFNSHGNGYPVRCFAPTTFKNWDAEIKKILNKWKSDNTHAAAVPLTESYGKLEIERIAGNAKNILSGSKISRQGEDGGPTIDDYWVTHRGLNIFYLADVSETNAIGGIDAEIIKSDGEIQPADLVEFLQAVQWQVHLYIISLVIDVERNHASPGGIYRDLYFHTKNRDSSKTINHQSIRGFHDLLDPTSSGAALYWKQEDRLRRTMMKLRNHFAIADGKRGNYWLGYRQHAFEVACTVAGIIDILFLASCENGSCETLESAVRRAGPNLVGIDQALENKYGSDEKTVPHLFKQLFRGLQCEKQLFMIPEYRDHFIHAFYVFVVGMILLKTAPKGIIGEPLSLSSRGDQKGRLEMVQTWFLVALWHDIAYILEKGGSILERYVLQFMKNPVREKGLLPWSPGLGHLMQIENFLDDLRNYSDEVLTVPSANYSSSDVVIARAFDAVDHGIWSGLMVGHGWEESLNACLTDIDENDYPKLKGQHIGRSADYEVLNVCARKKKPHTCKNCISAKKFILKYRNERFRHDVVRAIMPHHLSLWDIEAMLKSFRKQNGEDEADKSSIQVRQDSNPLGYLLTLCDVLSQAGREAPELAGEHPSMIGIRFAGIKVLTDRKEKDTVVFNLWYKNRLVLDDYNKFYVNPLERLGLNASLRKPGALDGKLRLDFYSGESTNADEEWWVSS